MNLPNCVVIARLNYVSGIVKNLPEKNTDPCKE